MALLNPDEAEAIARAVQRHEARMAAVRRAEPPAPLDEGEVVELYRETRSCRAVARWFGLGHRRVARICRAAGLEVRRGNHTRRKCA